MEGILDSQHGTAILLVSIVVVLGLQLVARIGEFVFKLLTHKSKTTDSQITKIDLSLTQNTQALRDLRIQIGILEREIAEIDRFRSDLQKIFAIVKALAGKRWVEIKKAVENDSLPKG